MQSVSFAKKKNIHSNKSGKLIIQKKIIFSRLTLESILCFLSIILSATFYNVYLILYFIFLWFFPTTKQTLFLWTSFFFGFKFYFQKTSKKLLHTNYYLDLRSCSFGLFTIILFLWKLQIPFYFAKKKYFAFQLLQTSSSSSFAKKKIFCNLSLLHIYM